jgi:hypothetical protein
MSPTPVPLHLGPHAATSGLDVSGVAAAGDVLFLAPDEGASLLALRRDGAGWGSPEELPLAAAVDLPGGPDDEVDAEGLDVVDGALWVVGSHSAKRKRVKPGTPVDQVGARLARTSAEKSRRLLARLPLRDGPDGARPVPGAGARLPSGRRGLFGALAADEHLAPFLAVPGKDNGFDVEGLAVLRDRVVLGLRGPVLRGWAVLLGLAVHVEGSELVLGAVTKHFVDLDGLGVRDLARDGDDLLALVGPTMVLDGPARIVRLPGAVAAGSLPPAITRDEVEVVAELTVGVGCDRPEGLAVLPEGLLVLHDTPAAHRLDDRTLTGDLWPTRSSPRT